MEKIEIQRPYKYIYEYFIESDSEGNQTIINKNEHKDMLGHSYNIKISRIIPNR